MRWADDPPHAPSARIFGEVSPQDPSPRTSQLTQSRSILFKNKVTKVKTVESKVEEENGPPPRPNRSRRSRCVPRHCQAHLAMLGYYLRRPPAQ
ncbi:hypothetical protein QVD99_000061 [Batrachochytrium dendrobatidis]|nr:hypothetical protein QVD99_000061 [Batrachochytrium dendrobatidis]